jgi:chromosome segregation ATPase
MALAKRLKDLASDAVSIPTPDELYRRKCADITEAKQKLSALVSRQLKIESTQQRRTGDTDAVVREKRDLKEKLERLQTEAEMIKQQIERPAKPMTAWGQAWVEAASHDPYSRVERGTPEQIAEAQAALDALVREYKLTAPSGAARDAWAVRKAAARTRLEALKGPPYPAHRPWATNEALAAARKSEGLKP